MAVRLNVEHRTSNIEHRIMKSLRFIDFKKSLRHGFLDIPRNLICRGQPNRIAKGRFALLTLLQMDRIPYSMLDVQCSMLIL